MSTNKGKSTNFSTQRKKALQANQELRDNGLVWRKMSNGDGVWRYDFRINGRRIQGVIGTSGAIASP